VGGGARRGIQLARARAGRADLEQEARRVAEVSDLLLAHGAVVVDVEEVEEGLHELLQAPAAEEGAEADDDGVDEVVGQVGRDAGLDGGRGLEGPVHLREGLRLGLRDQVEGEVVFDDVADDRRHDLHTAILGELPADGHGV
jgi:hypothetical protein